MVTEAFPIVTVPDLPATDPAGNRIMVVART
jgi:hypothetical protein